MKIICKFKRPKHGERLITTVSRTLSHAKAHGWELEEYRVFTSPFRYTNIAGFVGHPEADRYEAIAVFSCS